VQAKIEIPDQTAMRPDPNNERHRQPKSIENSESIESLERRTRKIFTRDNSLKLSDIPVISPSQSSGFSDSCEAAIRTMHHGFLLKETEHGAALLPLFE
jgi:hypothetical protein